ncbi:MAG: glycosyltransferase family 4 protein [Chloroflexota bacterium]|nr:glycosyltransferase family 4 protein [Chloroflexota bacterium]
MNLPSAATRETSDTVATPGGGSTSGSAGRGTGLLYFTPSDLLIPRVDRQCIMRFCEALAETGGYVEAVSLNVRLDFDEPTQSMDLFSVYGIRTPFDVRILPSFDRQARESGRVSALWRALAYSLYALWKLVVKRAAFKNERTVLYFKNYLLGVPFLAVRRLLRSRVLLLFEGHVPPSRMLDRVILRKVDGVVPVSRILARELEAEHGVAGKRICVAHQGVNLQLIERSRVDKGEARVELGLPQNRRLAVYTGKVQADSGEVKLLLAAAKLLPSDVEMVIVGGRSDQVALLREQVKRSTIENVRLPGFVAPSDVFRYQMAADVLVSYYPSDLSINKYRASPGKLFEYMAVRRPIVTADYPALREVLSPGAAVFVEKDDPERLAKGICLVLEDEALARRLVEQAYRDVQSFTWEARAARILDFAKALTECST